MIDDKKLLLIPSNIASLFWQRVEKRADDMCWMWRGAKTSKRLQYGSLYFNSPNGRRDFIAAHRLSFYLHFGYLPADMCVRHKCDVPLCVNPNHLELGTVHDNNSDRLDRNRSARGCKYPQAKLDDEKVCEIRRLRRERGLFFKKLGEMFGVSDEVARQAAHGKIWSHVTGEAPVA